MARAIPETPRALIRAGRRGAGASKIATAATTRAGTHSPPGGGEGRRGELPASKIARGEERGALIGTRANSRWKRPDLGAARRERLMANLFGIDAD